MGMLVILGSGLILGGKKTTNPDKQSFSNRWIRLITTQMKRKLHDDYTIHQKVFGNTIEMLFFWIKFSRTQDQGLQCRQEKSLVIVTHDIVPRDCIHRVIIQNGDRISLEISQLQGQHLRSRSRAIGLCSSSSPFARET